MNPMQIERNEQLRARENATAKFVMNHRRMLNQQLGKAKEAFRKAVVDGVEDPELATIEQHDHTTR